MFPVFISPLGSRKAILSLYWATSSPMLASTPAIVSLFGGTTRFGSTDELFGAPALRGRAFDRTKSAHDLGAEGGETCLTGSCEEFASGRAAVSVEICWDPAVALLTGSSDLGFSDFSEGRSVPPFVDRRGVFCGMTGTTGARGTAGFEVLDCD